MTGMVPVTIVGVCRSAEEGSARGERFYIQLAEAARVLGGKITRQSWRALELTKLALRSQRPATTTFDITAQALLFGSQDKHDRMTAFLERRRRG